MPWRPPRSKLSPMPTTETETCPCCPHELEEHELDEETGLLECEECDCQIDPAEHGLVIEVTDDEEDEDEDDEEDDYDLDDDEDDTDEDDEDAD